MCVGGANGQGFGSFYCVFSRYNTWAYLRRTIAPRRRMCGEFSFANIFLMIRISFLPLQRAGPFASKVITKVNSEEEIPTG